MAQQPTGMTSGSGVILTIGMVCSDERFAYVMPLATNSSSLDLSTQCKDAVVSFMDSVTSQLQALTSIDAYIAYVQATGMISGSIPWRSAFASTDFPGLDTGAAHPTNVAAIGLIYQDPADEGIGAGRIRQARTFLTAISGNRINNNQITTTLADQILTLMTTLQAGWPSFADSSSNWYRVLDVPKPTGTSLPVKRLLVPEVRGGVYTQKRRLVPRVS